MPGYDVQVLDESAGHEVERGTLGNIVVKLPLPPGCLPTLWHAAERLVQATQMSFPATTRRRMRAIAMPTAISSSWAAPTISSTLPDTAFRRAMEEVLASHKDVAECAVIGAADALKGELPVGFLVLKAGVTRNPAEVEKEVVDLVRERIGPVAAFEPAHTVARLPKTRSGRNPARHNEEDRRSNALQDAGDHRRSGLS